MPHAELRRDAAKFREAPTLSGLADNLPTTTAIHEVMTKEVVACRADEDITKAEQLMSEQHKSRILWLDDGGKLAGVISLSDIAQHDDSDARR